MKPNDQPAANKAVIERMLVSIADKGFAAQADFFAPETINHGVPVTRHEIRVVLEDIAGTFPDALILPLHMVAEGDWVTLSCQLIGTHRGTGKHAFVHDGLLAGMPPTGRKIRVHHIHMFRLADELIVEHTAVRDDIGMMRQLGLSPEFAAGLTA